MPVGQLLGQQPRPPSKWGSIARWRDWSISVKLAAVTLVPIMIALVLGGITIGNQVARSNNYERIGRLVTLSADVRALVDALQRERTETARLLIQGTVGSTPELDAARAAVDKAIAPINTDTDRVTQLDNSVAAPGSASNNALARLGEVRQHIAAGQVDSIQALDAYSAMTSALLTLDTSLVAGMNDDAVSDRANALHALQVAKEEVSTSQVLMAYGISRGSLTPTLLNQLRTAEVRLADRLEAFRAFGTGAQQQDFDRTVTGPDFDNRGRMASSVLAAQGAGGNAFSGIQADQWASSSTAVVNGLRAVSGRIGDEVGSVSSELVDSSGTDAGLLAVLLFGALVVTAAVVFLITRQLLRSLRMLRRSALDVADRQLPEAVQNIQEGREQSAAVQPVAVGTTDEIGEVAKAFDEVHSQALRLAIEQAGMRTAYSSVFINLSRRSQSLVQRQLQLIERLERDEEDADQLATLFQLDHLATRMRRNNENLMVLSGAEPGRRSGQPVSTTDVLRAAASEIEQYQRVVVQTPPDARIIGYAASDLMRLVAELLDNATAFSAPETQVTVSTRVSDDRGLLIDIIDKGIGMNESEVAEANARLHENGTIDLATSRRMGLFVVGRLAGRHHIGVELHGGKDIVGVRATVTVPAELVMGLPEQTAVLRPEPAYPTEEMPRRRTVNGSGKPAPLTSLAGTTSGTLGDGAAAPNPWSQNGHSGVLPMRPPSDLEVSGTALFSPVPADDESGAAVSPLLPPAPAGPAAPASSEMPGGKDLFAANTDAGALTEWWSTAAVVEPKPAPPPPPEEPELTPIFDETLSAWFRAEKPPAAPETPSAKDEAERADESVASTKVPGESGDSAATAADGDSGADSGAAESSSAWAFAADESWRTVQEVSKSEVTSYTEAGLPQRRRGKQLMPGSATPSAPAPSGQSEEDPAPLIPVRDPADVRGRLSSFQRGVKRGRHAAQEQGKSATTAQKATAGGPVPVSAAEETSSIPQITEAVVSGRDEVQAAEQAPVTGSGLPRRTPRAGGMPQREPVDEASTVASGLPRRTPGSVGSPPPHETAGESQAAQAGLPRRTPGAATGTEPAVPGGLPQRTPVPASGMPGLPSLPGLPGTSPREAAEEVSAPGGLPRRTPSGASGMPRWSAPEEPTAQPAAEGGLTQRTPGSGNGLPQRQPRPVNENPLPQRQPRPVNENPLPQRQPRPLGENALPQREPVAETAVPQYQPGAENPLPQRQPLADRQRSAPVEGPAESSGAFLWQKPQLDEPVEREPENPATATGSSWSFATDDSWRTVQAVSQSAPSGFTPAGLPRRRRGEQLLPGSASSPGAPGPRTQRDPQDVRGRLNSFQQGVRRGRHQTAQAADSEHETMEGE
uniref:sensor histidine kinase n=1 Tax=Amycolatopsis cynarae TaxID=2995223 RepID=UPI0038991364